MGHVDAVHAAVHAGVAEVHANADPTRADAAAHHAAIHGDSLVLIADVDPAVG